MMTNTKKYFLALHFSIFFFHFLFIFFFIIITKSLVTLSTAARVAIMGNDEVFFVLRVQTKPLKLHYKKR